MFERIEARILTSKEIARGIGVVDIVGTVLEVGNEANPAEKDILYPSKRDEGTVIDPPRQISNLQRKT